MEQYFATNPFRMSRLKTPPALERHILKHFRTKYPEREGGGGPKYTHISIAPRKFKAASDSLHLHRRHRLADVSSGVFGAVNQEPRNGRRQTLPANRAGLVETL